MPVVWPGGWLKAGAGTCLMSPSNQMAEGFFTLNLPRFSRPPTCGQRRKPRNCTVIRRAQTDPRPMIGEWPWSSRRTRHHRCSISSLARHTNKNLSLMTSNPGTHGSSWANTSWLSSVGLFLWSNPIAHTFPLQQPLPNRTAHSAACTRTCTYRVPPDH